MKIILAFAAVLCSCLVIITVFALFSGNYGYGYISDIKPLNITPAVPMDQRYGMVFVFPYTTSTNEPDTAFKQATNFEDLLDSVVRDSEGNILGFRIAE